MHIRLKRKGVIALPVISDQGAEGHASPGSQERGMCNGEEENPQRWLG